MGLLRMGRSVTSVLLVTGILLLGKVQGLCEVPASVPTFTCKAVYLSPVLSLEWKCPEGTFNSFNLSVSNMPTEVIPSNCVNGNQIFTKTGLAYNTKYSLSLATVLCDKASTANQITCQTSIGVITEPVIYPGVQRTQNSFKFKFDEFDSRNGPIKAYAVIITTEKNDKKPPAWILSKKYSDYKDKNTNTYVTWIEKTGLTRGASNRANTRVVTVGDGSPVSGTGYTNGKLDPSKEYRVAVAGFIEMVYSSSGLIMEDKSSFVFSPYSARITTSPDPGVIAGAVVGSLLGIALVGVLGYFIWRKRSSFICYRQGGENDKRNVNASNMKTKEGMRTTSFVDQFFNQQSDSLIRLSREYETFSSLGVTQSQSAAEIAENRSKNRYNNVLPYDISRVKLSVTNNPNDDYINANYIPGYKDPKAYIAAQGPLPQTVNDFWRMIWEKDVRAVVMLTRCVETGKVKCEEYWPSSHPKEFNRLTVSPRQEDVLPEWTIRDLELTNRVTNQSHSVRHFHFTAWPDHGVPQTTDALINFRNIISVFMNKYPRTPMLVHCSAGVGRTGTLIALDRIIKQIEEEDRIDVHRIVHNLWLHRNLMVQTEGQYIFLNKCAADYIQSRGNPPKPDLNTSTIYEVCNPYASVRRNNV